MRPNKFSICPDTELPGLYPLLSTALVVSPFEEEEEGIGVASEVLKVEGEDPGHPRFSKGEQGEVVRWRSISWVRAQAPWPDPEEAPEV